MSDFLWYVAAAVAEIAGCACVWAWLRQGKSAWMLAPGGLALGFFAFALTRIDIEDAGRAFAAYGGVYIAASLAWLYLVDGVKLSAWDIGGAAVCLAGAGVILYGATQM